MKNSEIAKVFSDIADLLELKGENVFKIRAYQKVVRAIEQSSEELEQLVVEDRLREGKRSPAMIRKIMTSLGSILAGAAIRRRKTAATS